MSRTPYIKLDRILIICYLLLVAIGCTSIFASIYDDTVTSPFSLATRSGYQIIWAGIGIILAMVILFVTTTNFYISTCWWFYAGTMLLLMAVLVFGREINGSKSWFVIGPFGFQPSEISKISTSMALALTMSKFSFRFSNLKDKIKCLLVVGAPILLIAAEPDMGTILVYMGFTFVLYREGLSGWLISFGIMLIALFIITLRFSPFASVLTAIGILSVIYGIFINRIFYTSIRAALFIGIMAFLPRLMKTEFFSFMNIMDSSWWLILFSIPFLVYTWMKAGKSNRKIIRFITAAYIFSAVLIFSVDFIFDNILKPHHRDRIENLLGIKDDPYGAGYNVNQSMIAIGSGGFAGKGFLEGTQTKFNFVPEQSTDFIFCTIGEEWGFLGAIVLLAIYFTLIVRILYLAEKQKQAFNRIYGYCVASCFFMHVVVNIGMTIGLMPVVGIPLPFISYGGSSFMTFTVLLFIFIKLDLDRWK